MNEKEMTLLAMWLWLLLACVAVFDSVCNPSAHFDDLVVDMSVWP